MSLSQERTEAKIRREREKLERCERRIKKLQDNKIRRSGEEEGLPRAYQSNKGESDEEEEGAVRSSSPHINEDTEGAETNVDPY